MTIPNQTLPTVHPALEPGSDVDRRSAPRSRSSGLLAPLVCSLAVGAAVVWGVTGMLTGATPTANAASAATSPAAAPTVTDRDLLSYGVGYELGRSAREGFTADGVDADEALVVRGFIDGLGGAASAYDEAELRRVLRAVHREMMNRSALERMKVDEAFRASAEAAAARSAEAIKAFAALPEVTALNDGIFGRRTVTGEGKAIGDEKVVRATWLVKRSDGVDVDRGAAVVDLRSLLPAIAKAISTMRVGDRWTLAVPPDAAYGVGGDPPRLGSNEALFAEVMIEGIADPADVKPRGEGAGR